MTTINLEQRIKSAYFKWLCGLVKNGKPEPKETYTYLLGGLYNHEFYALLGNDDDRGDYGQLLRVMWFDSISSRGLYDEKIVEAVLDGPCRFLEMLIALCIKAEDMSDGFVKNNSVGLWFWQVMDNLDLAYLSDSRYIDCDGRDKVDETVERVLNREYNFDGTGGMFPLRNAKQDQRSIEIWYQLSNYLMENVDYS